MDNQGLMNVGADLARLQIHIDKLGHTDAHHDKQTLENRLDIMEGCIQILEGAHLGHTNTDAGEFKGMHGFEPQQMKGDILQRLEGMQKKLDRIVKLLEGGKVTLSIEDALRL